MKMLPVAGPGTHRCRVPAHGLWMVRIETMLVIEVEPFRMSLDPTVVDHGLPVILAFVLQIGQLERPHGTRCEPHITEQLPHLRIVHLHIAHRCVPDDLESSLLHSTAEILGVHSTAEAFSPEDGVRIHLVGYPPVSEDIGEVQFPALLQHPVYLPEDQVLPGGEVDHAVGDHYIDRGILYAGGLQVLDVSLPEIHVGLGVSEPLRLTL